jgi:hypothetical protein
MKIDDIMLNLAALNSSTEAPVKSKRKSAPVKPVAAKQVVAVAAVKPPAKMTAIEAAFSDQEDPLKDTARRIIAAFGLEKQGVTVEKMVAGVLAFEQPYQGMVQ